MSDRIMNRETGEPEGKIVGKDVLRISTGEKYAEIREEIVCVDGDYRRASMLYDLNGKRIGGLRNVWPV